MQQLKKFFDQLDEIYRQAEFNGAYGVVSAEKILHANALGFSDFEASTPFTTTTKTCLGSLTKQFTALGMLLLEAEGKINLNRSLAEFFPEYIYAEEITLLQMIHMSSGVPDYTMMIYEESLQKARAKGLAEAEARYFADCELDQADDSLSEILALFNDRPLDFQSGSQFAYRNLNYALLGDIITRVTGKSFGEYLQEKIFVPLEMSDTSTTTDDSQAVSYRLIDGQRRRYETGTLDSADGGMVSTLSDMLKWLQAILSQKLLSAADWERVFTLVNEVYGFGWMKLGDWYYHGGEYLGFYAEIFLHRETQIGKIMLYNLESSDELDQISMDQRSIWRDELTTFLRTTEK